MGGPTASNARAVVGREPELESIARFVDDVPNGPAILVLEGEAGIGKTTLWQAGVDRAAELGLQVLVTRAGQSEAKLSFTALGDLLEPVVDEALPDLPDPQRSSLEMALLRIGTSGPSPDPRAVSLASLAVLRSAVASKPVLIGVDDLQWVDASSARVLEFCVRRIRDEPIGVLSSVRVGDGQPPAPPLARSLPGGRVQRLSVGPMPAAELGRVIRERLGSELPHPVVRRLHAAAAGNPFFAIEVAREVVRHGVPGPGEPLPVPRDLAHLLKARIEALPKTSRDVLLLAASASRPTVELVRSASGLGARTAAALSKAESAGVVGISEGAIHFAHPLLASTVTTSATAEERSRAHRRLARNVEEPEERARHLALSSVGPDPKIAAALDEAARHARTRGAPDAAAELSELAHHLTPETDAEARVQRGVEAAAFHFDAGDAIRATTLLEEAIERSRPGSDRARILNQLSEISWLDLPRVQGLCERALEEAEGDAEIGAAIHEHLAWVGIYRGDLGYAAEHASASIRYARRIDDTGIRADSHSTFGMIEFLTGRPARDAMAVAMRLQDEAMERPRGIAAGIYTAPRTCYGLQLLWAGELDNARDVLERELAAYEMRGRYVVRDEILCYLAEVECRAGNWDAAERHAREAFEIGLESGHLAGQGQMRFPGALAAALRGDADVARSEAEEGLRQCLRNEDILNASCNGAVLGFLELSLSNPSAAMERLEPVLDFLRAMDAAEPGIIPCVPDAIEALVSLGRPEEAEALLETHEEKGRRQARPWALATAYRCRGLLLASSGDVDAGSDALQGALTQHERVPQPFELGRTLLVKGEVERRAKRKRSARESLSGAHRIFEELGARLWAERARAELERVGGTPVGPAGLTATERRVAELVAQGMTNREVADTLFISVKTVEANLSRVFHKLGLRSRAELIRKLVSGADPDA